MSKAPNEPVDLVLERLRPIRGRIVAVDGEIYKASKTFSGFAAIAARLVHG